MRMTRGWTGLRTTVIALGFAAFSAAGAKADAIMNYSTLGTIQGTGVTGTADISFDSVGSGSFNAPSGFSLGNFVVKGNTDGSTTTYKDTPFSITYQVNTVNGAVAIPNETPITVTGVLNGSITGENQSSLAKTTRANE